ncbi:MAG: type II toxin-antitoxin system VapC family toxin, partial [Kiritimatiellae bacterium]|nr:type II toxin-antitoxin system VapC family toxin [Kiritimatiellia bacterium]
FRLDMCRWNWHNGRRYMETQTKKLKVYCETSFWSWLASDPATAPAKAIRQAYTHKWWQEVAPLCDIFVSQHVFDEAQRGDARLAERRYRLYSGQKQLDGYFDDVVSLAQLLQNGHAVPENETTDALHIATAAYYGMDVLLTWNCRHMANPITLPKTATIIVKAGYDCPAIMTPHQFLEHREEFEI